MFDFMHLDKDEHDKHSMIIYEDGVSNTKLRRIEHCICACNADYQPYSPG